LLRIQQVYHFFDCPDMARYASLHRRGDTQRLVDAAEVVGKNVAVAGSVRL